jgi:hypothetical protein
MQHKRISFPIVGLQLDVENSTSREGGSNHPGYKPDPFITLRQKVDDQINVDSPKYSSKPATRKDAFGEQDHSESDSEHFIDLQPAGQDSGGNGAENPEEFSASSADGDDVELGEKETTQIQETLSTVKPVQQQDHLKGMAILRQLVCLLICQTHPDANAMFYSQCTRTFFNAGLRCSPLL